MTSVQAELLIPDDLPRDAGDAARVFYSTYVEQADSLLETAEALVIVMPSASSDHDDWRRAAVRDLARRHAPKRINMIAGGTDSERVATLVYLASAPGVTGQLLQVAGQAQPDRAE